MTVIYKRNYTKDRHLALSPHLLDKVRLFKIQKKKGLHLQVNLAAEANSRHVYRLKWLKILRDMLK